MKLINNLPLATIAGLALAFGSISATAQTTLLSEGFSGLTATDLVGTTTGDGNDWTGSSTFQADGTTEGSNYRSAYLVMPEAVVPNEVYTLTATFSGPGWNPGDPAHGNEPLRVGLCIGNLDFDGDTDGDEQKPDLGAFDAMIFSDARGRLYPESSVNSSSDFESETVVAKTVTIILDTQTNPLDYQLSIWTGGVQIGSTQNIGVQAFDHLWIGHERPTTNTDGSYFDEITLTKASGADNTPPIADTLAPLDDATGVVRNTDLVITFDEDVQAGTGNIIITETGVGTFESIPVGDGRVSITGPTVTINPTGIMDGSTDYDVQIAAGVITDTATALNAWPGTSDWNFTTGVADETAPDIDTLGLSPADDANFVAVNADLVITFDENVQAGSGNIVITATGGSLFESIPVGDARVSFSGAVVTINPSGTLLNATDYDVQMIAGVITDTAVVPNNFAGITDATTWNFTTAGVPTLPLEENFSGLLADDLVGTPTTDGNLWTGSSTFQADGTTDGADAQHAHLALPAGAIVSGKTYNITANFTGPGWGPADPNEQFLAVGFSVGNLNEAGTVSDGAGHSPSNSFGRIEVKSDGRFHAKANGGTTSQEGNAITDGSTGQAVTVLLDTTDPLEYFVTYYWGSDELGSGPYSLGGAPAIDHIYIAQERPTSNTDDSYFDQVRVYESTGFDWFPPVLATLNPDNEATGAQINTNLVLTFDELVQAGTGNIVINQTGVGVFDTIDVTNTAKVTFSGNTVTINPDGLMLGSTDYDVEIALGVITDTATSPNDWAGPSAWSFTTGVADNTNPAIDSLSPVDDANFVLVDSDLVMTFDENVQAGSGDIVITATGGSTFETIPVGDARVSFSGAVVTINPSGTLANATDYDVQMAVGVITDTSPALNTFAGFTLDTDWNFTTAAVPTLPLEENFSGGTEDLIAGPTTDGNYWTGSSTFNADGTSSGLDTQFYNKHAHLALPAGAIVPGKTYNITATFNGPGWPADPLTVDQQFLAIGFSAGGPTGSPTGSDVPTGSYGRFEVKSDGRYNAKAVGDSSNADSNAFDNGYAGQTVTVVLDTTVAPYEVTYYWGTDVLVGPFSLGGTPAIDHIYIAHDRTTEHTNDSHFDQVKVFDSTGLDWFPPELGTLNPADETTGVAINSNLVLDFDENVQAGTGNIVINQTGVGVFESIPVGDPRVSFSGTTVTIDPAGLMLGSTAYDVQIALGVITDTAPSPNDWAGISDWNFSTGVPDTTAPDVLTLSPADNAVYVLVDTDLVITFDEPVQKGTGDIVITETGNGIFETIPVGDARVSISGAEVTINPNGTLANDADYYVNIPLGAIKDTAIVPNDFAGIPDTWNFDTGAVLSLPLEENFSGLLADDLVGAPTNDGNYWLGSTSFKADGTTAGSNNQHAHLAMPSAVVSGEKYTITATFDGPGWAGLPFGVNHQFMAVGFSVGGPTGVPTGDGEPTGSFGRIEVKSGGSYRVKSVGIGSDNDAYAGDPASIGQTVSVVLDTTDPADYTVTYYWGSTLIEGPYSIGTPAIDHIYIAQERPTTNTDDSYFDKVTLSTGVDYDAWAAGFPGLTNPAAGVDFDGGGLATGIEWVVGGDPTDPSDDAGLAPTIDSTTDPDGKLLFIFRRTDEAAADDGTTIGAEYSNDLAGWTTAVHAGTGASDITITEDDDFFGAGVDKVTVALPASLAPDGKIFVRLNVGVAE